MDLRVFRNDKITPERDRGAEADAHHHFAGALHAARGRRLQRCHSPLRPDVPMLGVCLGHQCIGHVFGGEVIRNYRVMHGKTSPIHHDGQGVFRGLSNPFEATRYHSLVINRERFTNPDFVVTAWTDEDEIMGVRHRTWPLHGVQFHPESFLTLEGPKLLKNFVEMTTV